MRTTAIGLATSGLLTFLLAGPAAPRAFAQYGAPSVSLSGGQRPQGVGGFRVGEGVFLRAGVLAEVGYDSNVFYNDDPGQKADSAALRVTPSLELTNANREGTAPPLAFSLAASLVYREYLKEDEQIRQQRAFNPTFSGSLGYNRGTGISFAISDQFTRLEEPPYVRGGEPITRDSNQGVAQMGLAPGGGRIQTIFRYTNTLDLFETTGLDYANRMGHDFMIDGSWRWLPKTALFLQGGVGYMQYLDDQAEAAGKKNSIPYRVLGGLRGLVTPKLTASLGAGFADAIYDDNPGFSAANPSGLSNLSAQVGLSYAPVTFTSIGVSYGHEFRDSPFIGDYYDLDFAGLTLAQQVGAFVLTGNGRYEYRRYQGFVGATMDPISRKDHIWMTSVQADYYLQKWFYAGVGYANLINRSTIPVAPAGFTQTGLDYTKHVVMGRLGITY